MPRGHRLIRRVPVHRYLKSGKLTAFFARGGYIGLTAIELSSDMSSIVGVRNPRYLKRDTTTITDFKVEFVEEGHQHVDDFGVDGGGVVAT